MIAALLCYEKIPGKKTRWDLVRATGEIPMFQPVIYVSDYSTNVKAGPGRKSNLGISASFNGNTRAISSIFLSIDNPNLGHGDIKGTNDLLLFRFTEDSTPLDVVLLEGRKNLRDVLFNRFLEGELDEEIDRLNRQAVAKTESPKKAA